MVILSIETSCDETAISIIEARGDYKNARFKVLANQIASQAKLHARYGGVYPMLAKREHIKNLPVLLKKALKEIESTRSYKLKAKSYKLIDMIAVTYGPGLEPALWTGITFAQELSRKWNVPIVPVNHMEGHFFSALVSNPPKKQHPYKLEYVRMLSFKFPILALLVSGGHTELILSKKFLKYKIVGETLDDAAGEAFDKVARMLGLPYPGGPEISKLAERERKRVSLPLPRGSAPTLVGARGSKTPPAFSHLPFTGEEKSRIKLPRPMLKSPDFNFSFSGLKTAVLYLLRDLKAVGVKLDKKLKAEIAREFEDAVVEVLVTKTIAAARKYGVQTILVGGGVATNKHLQKEMTVAIKKTGAILHFPHPKMLTDNSLMIAVAGYFHRNDKKPTPQKIRAHGNLHF